MKRATLLTLLFSFCLLSVASAQMVIDGVSKYGDEWLQGKYNQPFFKVQLDQNGIYRVTHADIVGADASVTLPDVSEIQVYFRGEEIPVHVEGTGTFSTGEYIEFYGQKNDGWMDQFLYVEDDMQMNTSYSMFTDMSAYFITWNTGIPGMRYSNYTASGSPTAEVYCWKTVQEVWTDGYGRGETFTGGTSTASQADGISPRYYTAEGYRSGDFSETQSYAISTPQAYIGTPQATVSHRFHTQFGQHQMQYSVGNTSFNSATFSNWEVREESFAVSATDIGATTTINVSNAEEFRSASATIEYPHTFDFENTDYFEFVLNSSAGEQYIEVTNFNIGTATPILYDLTNGTRVLMTNTAGTLSATLPASTDKRQCVLVSDVALGTISTVARKEFVDYFASPEESDYIVLSSDKLIDNGGTNYIQQYADYRASVAGGNYTTAVVSVEQLYDQYGYGINRHEQSIKNFLKKAQLFWNSTHLFIIGKGWDKVRMKLANPPTQFDIVPTYGYPHSDYGFVLDHNSLTPWMAVGRIGAYTSDQVRVYLEKVQEYETVLNSTPNSFDDKSWAKKVLHFGGGDVLLGATIENTLFNLTNIIEPSTFGGNVTNFLGGNNPKSEDPAKALDFVRNGANLLTFFGHSAPNTIDFDIGEPDDYENLPNYPVFYAIGCNTNRIFDSGSTLSEDYVLIEDKGAIAWYGNTWVTSIGGLVPVATNFYENMSNDLYGGTFGEIFRESFIEFGTSVAPNTSNEMVVMSSMLHGDPAIRLHPHDLPDYVISDDGTVTDPKLVSLQDNNFTLNLAVANIGRNISTNIGVQITHLDPNNNVIGNYVFTEVGPAFLDTLDLTIPLNSNATDLLGVNTLQITLDPFSSINEVDESNNTFSIDFYIVESEIKPSYPKNFSIYPGGVLTLKASTTTSPTGTAGYHFQIDTTANFDSPELLSTTINSVGGVIEWTPNNTLVPNTVYYWRVSAGDIINEATSNWKVSSFTYLGAGSQEGWNQQHFYQYQENGYDGISLEEDRIFEFGRLTRRWKMLNGTGGSGLLSDEIALFEDGFRTGFNNYRCDSGDYPNARLNMVIYNGEILERYRGINPPVNCWGGGSWYMYDPDVEADRVQMINDIAAISSGDYVLFWTTQTKVNFGYSAEQWEADSTLAGTGGKNIFSAFEARADIQLVRDIVDEQNPYILVFKADGLDFPVAENYASSQFDLIEARSTLLGVQSTGIFTSPLIGTASSWGSVEWAVSQTTVDDQVSIDVIGIDINGQETTLLSNQFSSSIDLSSISAVTYPNIRLVFESTDAEDRTPAQLDYWRVYYTPVPDLAVAPNVSYTFSSPSLSLGDNLDVSVTVSNVSDVNVANTIDIELLIIDMNGDTVSTQMTTMPAINAQSSSILNLSYDTDIDLSLMEEDYFAVVNINPNQVLTESCYMNNELGLIPFTIESCPTDQNITVAYSSNQTIIASNTITASNIISSGAQIIYSAGTSITLEVGFHAQAGTDFHAFLGGCSLTPPARFDDTYATESTVETRANEDAINQIVDDQLHMRVVPNPVISEAQVDFYLPSASDVKLYVADLNGKVITQIDALNVQEGWNRSIFYLGNLTSGVYLILLESESGVQVQKFVVSH
ncbi:MAG: C25 family cysteine peptidase [Bacteroidota bacterium]